MWRVLLVFVAGITACGDPPLECRRSALSLVGHAPDRTFPESPTRATEVVVMGDGLEGWTLGIFDERCQRLLGIGVVGARGYSIRIEPPRNTTTFLSTAIWDETCQQWMDCQTGVVFVQDDLPPTISGLATTPPSPADANSPIIEARTEPRAEVEVFEGEACEGPPIARDRADGEGRIAVTVQVADDSTSHFVLRATDAVGNVSACSRPVVFEERSS